MNLKLGLASLTLALATFASVPAFAGDLRTAREEAPVAAHVMAPARRTDGFAAQIRARMEQIERALRADVARGRVRAQALPAFAQQRAQVDGALARTGRDGALRPAEVRRIDTMVDHMASLATAYRVHDVAFHGPRR
jgi:predicted RNA-binding Zn ribbon-like protein